MRLFVISLIINAYYYSHRSDFHESDWFLKQFISLMNCTLELLTLLLKLAIILTDLTFISLIGPQDNLFMNYRVSSTIHLGANAIITVRPSSHKSRFIYHFRIVQY